MDRPRIPEEVDETRTHVDLHLWGSPRMATVARTTEGRVAVEIDEGPADSPVAIHGTSEQIEDFARALLEGVRQSRGLPTPTAPLPPAEHTEQRPDGATAVWPIVWPPLDACPDCRGAGITPMRPGSWISARCPRCDGTGRVGVVAHAHADA